jgi:hypothetical protein
VLFLGQLGEGFNDPPKLIKTDQLESEVYWRSPGLSKQRIVGWRDRADLPTDIHYHRDHLGIVQNGFGDRIRVGEGDEVRDVPHPLSPAGDSLYDFAISDSLSIELPDHVIQVYELLVRPRRFDAPRVVGAVYLDVATAELVRFRFNFTRSAYLDSSLEDITVVLENAVWDGRFWLPRRQEIEIRRRTSWLDLPARGIIRGRWQIDSYQLNAGVPDSVFRGPEIAALPPALRDTFPWPEPLSAAIRAIPGHGDEIDVAGVRAQVADLVGSHEITRLASARPAAGSISDIVHFNRVEGLALGAGYRVRPGLSWTMTGLASYGLSDDRIKGGLDAEWRHGPLTLGLDGRREIHDIGDQPVISRAVNSISAQEGGADFGDYVLLDRAAFRLTRGWPAGRLSLSVGVEHAQSIAVATAPARGTFRPNPPLGDTVYQTATLSGQWHGGGVTSPAAWSLDAGVVGGRAPDLVAGGDGTFLRASVSASIRVPAGSSLLTLSGAGGRATGQVPRYRAFVLGGRGTLPGEPFRAYGGRSMALARIDWGWPVPFPALPLGPLGSTGDDAVIGPFVAAGWADEPVAGTPWIESGGVRPVAGVSLELFHRLLRTELGVGLRDGGVGFSVDVLRDLWPIL